MFAQYVALPQILPQIKLKTKKFHVFIHTFTHISTWSVIYFSAFDAHIVFIWKIGCNIARWKSLFHYICSYLTGGCRCCSKRISIEIVFRMLLMWWGIHYNTTVFLEHLTKIKSYSKTLYNVSSVTSLSAVMNFEQVNRCMADWDGLSICNPRG